MDNLRTCAIQLVFSMNDAKDAEVERGAEFVHEITKEEAKDLQLSQTFEELLRLVYLRTLVHKGAQAKLAMGVT